MTSPADFWERCPVCRARLKDSPTCPRCGMDFSQALEICDKAEELMRRSNAGLMGGTGTHRDAFRDALQAVRMCPGETTFKALALSALALGYYDLALRLWSAIAGEQAGGKEAGGPREIA